jgi:hypothetical protein
MRCASWTLTRTGNEVLYEVTGEDPVVLVEPWVMTPRPLRLVARSRRGVPARVGLCSEVEEGEAADQIRH